MTATEPAAAPAISADGLTKRFGSDGVLAVDDLSFSVARGEVCGLLGPNGAGKTTTMRMLLGLIQPSAGTAAVLGSAVTPGADVLARVGAMVEEPAFVPMLSGRRNLRLWWESTGASWEESGVGPALEVAGLGAAVDRKVRTYSHGMRQRLGIARALLGDPDLLVLDEPSNGLDPGEMREIRLLVRRLAGEGRTVLVSSHLLAEVEQVCDRVVVVNRGRLVASGTVAELVGASSSAYFEVDDPARALDVLRAQPGVVRAEVESPGLAVQLDGASRHALVAALVAAGVGVETVTARNRLEETFLALLGADA